MPDQKAFLRLRSLYFLPIALLGGAPASWAALDAGAELQRYHIETLQRIGSSTATEPEPVYPDHPSETAKMASAEVIYVTSFYVTGVSSLAESEVADVLAPFVGRELNTADIHNAADALNRLYRDQGYFLAKVYIPPQEVSDTIRLDVYEGYLDTPGKEVVTSGERVRADVIQQVLDAHLKDASVVQRSDYERALLITEDLPGISTSSTLYPGASVGTARLRTVVTDLSSVNGNIDFDNFGSRATGQGRFGTTVYINSPTKVGDQVVTRLVSSSGGESKYAYITYLRPVSPRGTRVGLSLDYFDYDSAFIDNLGYSEGEASDVRLYLTHPLIRSRHQNLNFRADLSWRSIDDRNDLSINADRDVSSLTLALHGDDDHPWLGSGLTTFNVAVTLGHTDIQGNQAYRVADGATTDTGGGFGKVNLSASRLLRLSDHWSVLADVNAQWSNTDLDSSQRFYLGGYGAVAGYPIGEASGDSGAEYGVELRRDFVVPWTGTLTGGLFFQQGWVRMHESPWPGWQGGNTQLENEFALSSAGVNVLSTVAGSWIFRGSVGWQVGDNPMRDPDTGRASDDRGSEYRGWVQVIKYF